MKKLFCLLSVLCILFAGCKEAQPQDRYPDLSDMSGEFSFVFFDGGETAEEDGYDIGKYEVLCPEGTAFRIFSDGEYLSPAEACERGITDPEEIFNFIRNEFRSSHPYKVYDGTKPFILYNVPRAEGLDAELEEEIMKAYAELEVIESSIEMSKEPIKSSLDVMPGIEKYYGLFKDFHLLEIRAYTRDYGYYEHPTTDAENSYPLGNLYISEDYYARYFFLYKDGRLMTFEEAYKEGAVTDEEIRALLDLCEIFYSDKPFWE